MPPEPLPWDRKDFFRERKHERSESLGSVARWRDSSHHGGSRELSRWGSADFRRPLGHGKQGGWHFFPEESGHGYVSSRASEKVLEDESCRSSISRGEGKYGRSSRENRGSYNQREWRGHSWEANNGFSNTPGRAHDLNNEQKSRDDLPSYSSHSNGGFGNTWEQIQFKDQHDKAGGSNGLGTGQKCDRENSLGLNDWKPMKWTRSGSMSSRGSGFSHLSGSKSVGAVDSSEAKVETQTKNATPVQSPSADANACVTSARSEETTSRKKPRLGWGEGLAKYEKKKVDGPEVTLNKDGAIFAGSNTEPSNSLSSSLFDKSPRVMSFSDCASPATPSSVACSSSPGLEEKSFGKAVNIDNDSSNLCGSPGPVSQNHTEGCSFNLEKLDFNSIATLGSSLVELLQSDDPNSVDSSFVRSTAINKLLVWKAEISKTLEVTETEIDSLENELKSLNSIPGGSSPSASSSLPKEDHLKSCEEQGVVTHQIPRPALLQIVSFGDAVVEKIPICNGDREEICANVKEDDVDSPGTVTSKFVEPLSLAKSVSSYDTLNDAAGDLNHSRLTNKEGQHSVPASGGEETGPNTCVDCSMLTEGEVTPPVTDSLGLCIDGEDKLNSAILSSNKELAEGAHSVFNKLLPQDECNLDISRVCNASSWQNHTVVKEKFARRKQFLKFKERVLTLKLKAYQHLWKEDMRLLSIRKHRAKSQKKFELSFRPVHSGYQKHRSSIRSRFSSPAGSLSLVPTTEVINFTSKLLLDSQVKKCRDALQMPALILDKKEKIVSRFISDNGLVEDPCAVEKERAMINPWTPEEKEIFMVKLATFGKDFKRIASFLDHKTTADCVEFYYKNHKSDSFEKKKKLDSGKQVKSLSNATYLMLGKKWNREMNAASLDILGEASVIAANADVGIRSRQTCSGRLILGGLSESKAPWGDDVTFERSSSLDILGNDRETVAADVLAGICGSLSSEAMSSCITSSVDPGEGYKEWKSPKVDSVSRRPLTPDVTQRLDDGTCSDESCGEMDPTEWTDEEKSIFIQAVSLYGRDFAMISQCVRSRSRDQCKVFFSKARKCLGLDVIHPGPGNERTFTGDDANGSGSGSENACAREMGSGICSDKSGSKMDEDLPLSAMKMNLDESDPAENLISQTALSREEEKDEREVLEHKRNVEASESQVSDACPTRGIPNLVSDGDSNVMKGVDEPKALPIRESNSVLVSIETGRQNGDEQGFSVAELVSVCVGNDEPLNTDSVVGIKPVDEISSDGLGNQMEGLEEKCNASTSQQSGLEFVVHDSNSTGNTFHLVPDRSSCSGFSLNPDYQHQVSLELNSKDKSCVISLSQETSLASANSMSLDSGAIQLEKNGNEDKMSTTLDFQESKDVCHISVCRDESYEHLTGLPLLTNAQSSQVLRAYPLQMPIKKEVNGDIRCRNVSEVQSLPKSDRSSNNHLFSQDCYLQRCNNLKSESSMPEFPLMSPKIEQAIDHSKSRSQSLSDSENSGRSGGDVKLFGKILSNPSSLNNSNSGYRENEEKEGSHEHKSSNKSSNLKFGNLHNSDENSALLKFDRNNYMSIENVQMRNYAYWDGTRLQATFPTVPDSAILLAKYPAAFGNFPTSTTKMEQQTLQAVVKGNELHVNGASVFPTREISNSNGMVDHPVFRSREAAKVQPFTVDVKQRADMFSEAQRRNGIEAIASFQHQGRGMVGINVLGRGGIVVGGPCTTGVSDPVAALKMHFAKTEQQFGGQTSGIIREDESWRGNGDIGR
ncbi:Octamer-binding transcription factor [Trema orientale]|uniref:Octamer-binding transcription factor n=1 Tax=Trema orientale TaxID=63057 RepID=A0A2P5CPT9_TREOI|nr:Octamer-binding transcription factor [Trema orientale]